MANLKKKIQLLGDAILGNLVKIQVKYDLYVRHSIDISGEVEPSVMVTLTSYGHRLRHSVEYTLYSILKQSLRPERIIVWVYEGEYADNLLPKSRKLLEKYGVEFHKYPKDIRSYKKLIPTLEVFPDYHHIIVDDDIYYTSTLIKELYEHHLSHPKDIIAHAIAIPQFTGNGDTLLPYKQWPQYNNIQNNFQYNPHTVLPIGYGGIFYPKDAFDKEVENESVFLQLCPQADDLWFYVHSLRLGLKKTMVTNSDVRYIQTDLIRQVISKDRLHDTNFGEGQNNVQLDNLLNHYNLRIQRS
ncbi:hypothetical protein [Prevotella sp. E2-28]|uniref:hypothetical protein n=1 Tax=Prevotella sp. E2-28 TaxID=2913620 RepID=UPI001EDB1B54|nr:hypothetical protein [Prevotella sp. E2-28]UKK52973.1 hypothetical protein L6465_10305 [Prevotella sp. E2-28]